MPPIRLPPLQLQPSPLFITGAGLDAGQQTGATKPLYERITRATAALPMEQSAAHDGVVQLALSAAHDAWHSARLGLLAPARVGLCFLSTWGAIETTRAYLDTMYNDAGKYASPRLFTRSVYSAAASIIAIHFGIHGPCETLSHDAFPVLSCVERAAEMLEAKRADAVLICWADQTAAIAQELIHRAVRDLKKSQYKHYDSQGLKQGGAAVVLEGQAPARETALCVEVRRQGHSRGQNGAPLNYPTHAAALLVEAALQAGQTNSATIWQETDPRGRANSVELGG